MCYTLIHSINAQAYWLDFSTQTLHTFWYLFIMTIDTSPLCLYKVSESIYILHKMLLWVLTTATARGLLSLYISTLAASVFTPSTNGLFLSGFIYIDS